MTFNRRIKAGTRCCNAVRSPAAEPRVSVFVNPNDQGTSMNKKPEPLVPSVRRERCPVCGEYSYSPAGIHPQCAVKQADAKRLSILKAQPKTEAKATTTSDVRPWQKICPRCKVIVHVRKKHCECGYFFLDRARAPAPAESSHS